jgi:hypothetical protein
MLLMHFLLFPLCKVHLRCIPVKFSETGNISWDIICPICNICAIYTINQSINSNLKTESYHYTNPTERVGLVQRDSIIIFLKINLFSPWYSWKLAELALNNNHSLTLLKDFKSVSSEIKLWPCLPLYVQLKTWMYTKYKLTNLFLF